MVCVNTECLILDLQNKAKDDKSKVLHVSDVINIIGKQEHYDAVEESKWVVSVDNDMFICCHCHGRHPYDSNYCPDCGCRMYGK